MGFYSKNATVGLLWKEMTATRPDYFIHMIIKKMMNLKGPSVLCEGMVSLMITCGCP